MAVFFNVHPATVFGIATGFSLVIFFAIRLLLHFFYVKVFGKRPFISRRVEAIRKRGLPLVKKYQPWLGARMTVYPDTVDMLMENVAYLYSTGFNQFIIGPSYGPKWDEKAFADYEEQLDKIGDFYLEKKRNREPFRMNFFESKSGDRFCASNMWGCRAGRTGATVSASGKIYPCSKFLGLSSFDENLYCLGDVYTGITNLDAREEFVGMSIEQFSECIDCDAADYCSGGCPANNYNDRGCVSKPSPFDCAMAKIDKRVLQRFDEKYKDSLDEKVEVT